MQGDRNARLESTTELVLIATVYRLNTLVPPVIHLIEIKFLGLGFVSHLDYYFLTNLKFTCHNIDIHVRL